MMNTENSINILIVDDRPENLISLENILLDDEIKIFKAQSGLEALELLLLHSFALAILDVQMPDINGFELAELMRGKEQTKSIPIIFVTAGAIDAKYTFMGYDAGAVDFLYKPLDIRIVKSKVKVFKELEKQKIIIKNQLEQLSESLKWRDDFLSIVSHELKTPITSLRLQNQMALRNLDRSGLISFTSEKLTKTFNNTGKQLDKLTHLIEDLLDVTKISAGTLTVEPIESNFSLIIADILDRYSEQLATMKSLDVNIDGPVMVYCDPFRAEQVVINLISNAIKYAPNSPLEIHLSKENGNAILKIKDSGPGIDMDKLQNVFERFKRGKNNKNVNGLGLGLYISKQIIDAHRGKIEVESQLGVGTTFTVTFPAVP